MSYLKMDSMKGSTPADVKRKQQILLNRFCLFESLLSNKNSEIFLGYTECFWSSGVISVIPITVVLTGLQEIKGTKMLGVFAG